MKLIDLETPCLILEKDRLQKNADRFFEQSERLNVIPRPHVKTLKSVEAAKIYAPSSGRITVSTLKEAETFADAGYRDILYGIGVTPSKLPRIAELMSHGVVLTLFIDSLAAADAVAAAAKDQGVAYSAMIEVDVDGHRAGIAADSDLLIEIAQRLTNGNHARLRGVASHAGESYACPDINAIIDLAEQERALTVQAAERLREAGFTITDVSVGSTPTALLARDLTGVTELRAGVYSVFDLVMAGLGVCSVDDIALSVLTSVIGHQPEKGWVIVDAGWMATSSDASTSDQNIDQHFGVICDYQGNILTDLTLSIVNQEQGVITRRNGAPIDPSEFPYAARLRILPIHACATASQHNHYNVVSTRGSDDVIATWSRINAW